MKAIVVGCGIGGLTAAIAMRQAGHEVCLYERAPLLTEVGAGISLWANAFHALDLIGVGEAIRASSLGMVKSELRVKDGHKVVGSFDAHQIEQKMDTQPLVAIIHRAVLVDQLASRLPKDSLFFGKECVGLLLRAVPLKSGSLMAARTAPILSSEQTGFDPSFAKRSLDRNRCATPDTPAFAASVRDLNRYRRATSPNGGVAESALGSRPCATTKFTGGQRSIRPPISIGNMQQANSPPSSATGQNHGRRSSVPLRTKPSFKTTSSIGSRQVAGVKDASS